MINCLRCRACSLLPETDMAQPRPLIHCGKLGHAREMNLHGCLMARDDAPTRYIGEIERRFISAHYARHTSGQLGRILRRPASRVMKVATALGLRRGDDWKSVRASRANGASLRSLRASGLIYSPAQTAYILSVAYTDAWPHRGGNMKAGRLEESAQRKARIVARVAKLGTPRSWASIADHVSRQQPGFKAGAELRREKTTRRRRELRAHKAP